ncbi:MAG TPA: CCA tRNA nucleotidyltransferase, partial [bacterium]|nr:CCA tRNA nucleotidyltransferase [bacterium]
HVTRIELPPLPDAVATCLQRLRSAGGRAWVVGGAVRDRLLGLAADDYDLCTDLRPERVATVLPTASQRELGLGAVRVAVGDRELTITTLRTEANYGDHRRPDAVRFVDDVAVDARRRDFTVNALYYDPDRAELLDPCGGRADLEARILRCIGEPERRLREDPLRLLRAVRFAARYELTIDAATRAGMARTAEGLGELSAERCFAELDRMFVAPGRGHALRLLVDNGLAAVVLPEVDAMADVPQPKEYHPEGDVLTHVCLVLDHVRPNDPVQAWSAVLHDIGKPATFRVARDRIRFDGHDTLSARMADEVLRRLRAPRDLRERVVDVARQHIRFAALPQMRPVRAERWLRTPTFPDHLEFHRADCLGSHGELGIYEWARARLDALPAEVEPLLHGRDVLDLGIAPGPVVGELLRRVQRRLDEAPTAPSRRDALVLLRDEAERLDEGGRPGDR